MFLFLQDLEGANLINALPTPCISPFPARNRFNLRGQSPATEKTVEAVEGNAIDSVPSTTVRAARPRPTFAIRPRGRNVVSTTSAPVADDAEHTDDKVEDEVKEASAAPAPTPKANPALSGRARLNGARPSPLLNIRGRSNILGRGQTTTTLAPEPAPEAVAEEDLQETDVPSENEKVEEAEKQVG